MPEGEPLPRPRLQPRSRAAPAAPRRREGRGSLRADHVGRGARRDRHALPRHHRPTHGAEAIMPYSRAPATRACSRWCSASASGTTSAATRVRAAHCAAPTAGAGAAIDQRHRQGPRPQRAAALEADHPVGHQHPAHQPPPVADHRGGPCRRRHGRRDRPDPHDHRRRRRLVRPAAARHRRRPDAGDDARADPRRPGRPASGSPHTPSASTSWPRTSPSGRPSVPRPRAVLPPPTSSGSPRCTAPSGRPPSAR